MHEFVSRSGTFHSLTSKFIKRKWWLAGHWLRAKYKLIHSPRIGDDKYTKPSKKGIFAMGCFCRFTHFPCFQNIFLVKIIFFLRFAFMKREHNNNVRQNLSHRTRKKQVLSPSKSSSMGLSFEMLLSRLVSHTCCL